MALSVWWLSLYGFLMVLLGLALLDLLLPLILWVFLVLLVVVLLIKTCLYW